jgi:hypothetical protein
MVSRRAGKSYTRPARTVHFMEGSSVQKDIDGLQAWNTPVLSGLSG